MRVEMPLIESMTTASKFILRDISHHASRDELSNASLSDLQKIARKLGIQVGGLTVVQLIDRIITYQ